LVGLDRRDYKNENDGSMPANPTFKMQSQYASVFLKDILEAKGLNLEAGFRVNTHSEYGTNITWSVNPSLSIVKGVRLFANASTAFKAPTLDQLYGAFGANTGLNPEKAFTLEAGVQYVADENKINLRFVSFYRKINDVITYITINPNTFDAKYLNFDKQEDSGFEFEFTAKASDELTINGNYTYVDGTLTTKDYATNAERKVTGLLRRPRNQYNLNATLQATKKMSFNLGLQSFGKRYDSNSGTEVQLADYILVNGYCEYLLNNHFKFFADAQNMLGAKYEEVVGYNVLPTNLRVGFVAKF
jgi:vitamin B12 transporter